MSTSKEWNCLRLTWLTLIVALGVRLVLGGQFLLVPDEVNYWQWSRYLALGYHDHPPMIAWTIWLSTKVFGQNEFAVRLPTILGVTVASIYMSMLAGRWFSWRCALHAAVLSQGILLFNGTALIATPDGMLLPCWAGACYHAGRAMERQRAKQWLFTGVWFGLGLLSKYTMLLFLPALLAYMIFCPPNLKSLSRPAPWFSLLLGFLIFTPVLIWNSQNEWATFRHVLYMGGVNDHGLFTLDYIVDFLGSQMGLLSPLVFILLFCAWLTTGYRNKRLRYDDAKFLVWMSLTVFLVFLALSFHSRVYGNWPAPGYLSAIILIAALYSPGRISYNSSSRNMLWKFSVLIAYLFCIPVLIQVVYPVLPIPAELDRTAWETKGWDQLGLAVEQSLKTMPNPHNTFIFGLRYQTASELAFYMPGQPRTVSINRWNRPNVYDFWFSDDMVIGRDGVGVSRDKNIGKRLSALFTRLDPPQPFSIYRDSPWRGRELVQTLYIFRGYGFKGGLRWLPPDRNDIRADVRQTAR